MATSRASLAIAGIEAAFAAAWLFAGSSFRQQLAEMEIGAISEITPLPGHEAEMRSPVAEVRTATPMDPSCLTFFVTEEQTRPSTIILFEAFGSRAEFEKHEDGAPTTEFLARLKGREGDGPRTAVLRPSPRANSSA